MAVETIKVDLNTHESLVVALGNISAQATLVYGQLASIESAMGAVTSEGLAHDYILADNNFSIFLNRAQELQTLTEVMHQHALDTMAKFIDKDKVLATEVANLILNNPKRSAEEKKYIKEHSDEAVGELKEAISQQEANTASTGGGEG